MKKVMKYNPAFLTDTELIDSFVVRKVDLELMIEIIKNNDQNSNQNILVIGPRGSGKTMLLLRTAAAIRRHEILKNIWYPLIFGEETYEAVTAGEFLLESLHHLANQTNSERWCATYEELRREPVEERLVQRAYGQLMDFADCVGKRILLIVENMNILFDKQISKDDGWVIRKILQNDSRIMILGSAVSRFEAVENPSCAMYELFKIHALKPLTENECKALWVSIAGRQPEDNRIRPVQILTGSNPRLIAIISKFGANYSFRKLVSELRELVDEHTDYFKNHLDSLPSKERKVYLALADIWAPASAKEVAVTCRLSINKTSALLNRLVNRGVIVILDQKKHRKTYYLSERMYNIYYLMRRNGGQVSRVQAVIKFIIDFYGKERLVEVTRSIASEVCQLENPQMKDEHYRAYHTIVQTVLDKELKEKIIASTPKTFWEEPAITESITSLIDKSYLQDQPVDYAKSEKIYDSEDRCRTTIKKDPSNESAWSHLGTLLHHKLNRYCDAEAAYRKAIELNSNNVMAWSNLGPLLHFQLKRYDEAEVAYRKAIELKTGNEWTWARFGCLLHYELERYDEAEAAYKKAIEIYPKFDAAWALLGALLHYQMERYNEAEAAYRKAIEINPKIDKFWIHLAQLLQEKLERFVEAETAYQKAGESLHKRLEWYDEAKNAYRKALRLNPKNSSAWVGLIKLHLKEKDKLRKILDEVDKIVKSSNNAYLLNSLAWGCSKISHEEVFHFAEKWSKKSLKINPDSHVFTHTLATILAAQNKTDAARDFIPKMLSDRNEVSKWTGDALDLFTTLASKGFQAQLLERIERSPCSNLFEPFTTALKMMLGIEVKTSLEVSELAEDVIKRIKGQKNHQG